MKTSLTLLAIALAMLASSAKAATVIWDTAANITGDSNVITTGTLERAYNFGDGSVTSTTVNGVTFSAFAATSNPTTVGNTTLAASSNLEAWNGFGGTGVAPFSALSTSYKALLGQAAYTSGYQTVTLTLTGLTIGQSYIFQSFGQDGELVNRTGFVTGGANTAAVNYNTTNADGGLGQFLIGNFTADSTTQVFTYTGGTNGYSTVNAIQLRAVPEPATWALLAGSLTTVVILRRRRA